MDKDMEALSLWSASSSSVVGSLVRRAFNPNHRHGLRVALGAYYLKGSFDFVKREKKADVLKWVRILLLMSLKA
jgi:hypothetical protein